MTVSLEALSLDLTKGGKRLKLLDELLALFAGTRIIRIDVKKDTYISSESRVQSIRKFQFNYVATEISSLLPTPTD